MDRETAAACSQRRFSISNRGFAALPLNVLLLRREFKFSD
jgi:hypothetical protein